MAAIYPFMLVLITQCLLADFVVEMCDSLVGPVFPQCGQDMAQCVWPGGKHKGDICTCESNWFPGQKIDREKEGWKLD